MNKRSGYLHYWPTALLVFFATDFALAVEQRLKVEGVWSEDRLTVYKISQRDPSKNPRRIRVTGQILSIDQENRRLRVGPVWMNWRSTEQAQLDGIAAGNTVEIDANLMNALGQNQNFIISRIETGNIDSPDSIEIIGTVTGAQRYRSMNRIDLAGIPTWAPTRLYSNGRARTRRLGDRRPTDQFTIQLGDAELIVGGEVELSSSYEGDQNLDKDDDDDLFSFQEELQVDLFLSLNEGVSAYLELKAELGQEYATPWSRVASDNEFKRGQSWIYFDHPFDWPIGLQLGRQNFAEQREWWWDDDLDAIRFFFGSDSLGFDAGIAQEIAREDLRADDIDPEEEDIFRFLSSARWKASSAAEFGLFFLHHDDRSSRFSSGMTVDNRREDDVDAQLDWFGARLAGDFDVGHVSEIEYWFDSAIVRGDELVYDFDDFDSSRSIVTATDERSRSGWGVDIGTSIKFDNRFEPTLTLGYAFDDGDFRQTGLDDNNNRFNGVNRFRYYGELVRPELSNVRITTLALGLRFFEKSSLELIHHTYRQKNASSEHSLRIDADSNGLSTSLGTELNFVAGFREWKHWDIEVVGAYFSPGSAFTLSDPAWLIELEVSYNY